MKKLVLEGGTPYSHVRNAFIKFDWNYSNALEADELLRVAKFSMGLSMTHEQAVQVIKFPKVQGNFYINL